MDEDFVFTDLLNGNSKNSYFIESNWKKNLFLTYLFIKKKLLNLIFYHVELRKELTFHWYFVWKLKISIFCWTKSETKLFWYLFSQRNLINLISIKSNWKEDFVFYWLFDWKLKKFILYQVKLKKVLVSYLSSQRNIINLISITSNWKKTLFFTDLLNGNSKISYFFESNQKNNLFLT